MTRSEILLGVWSAVVWAITILGVYFGSKMCLISILIFLLINDHVYYWVLRDALIKKVKGRFNLPDAWQPGDDV